MIKKVLSLLAVFSVVAFCASNAFAQMTDDAVTKTSNNMLNKSGKKRKKKKRERMDK